MCLEACLLGEPRFRHNDNCTSNVSIARGLEPHLRSVESNTVFPRWILQASGMHAKAWEMLVHIICSLCGKDHWKFQCLLLLETLFPWVKIFFLWKTVSEPSSCSLPCFSFISAITLLGETLKLHFLNCELNFILKVRHFYLWNKINIKCLYLWNKYIPYA